MEALLINGSPHFEGNTARALKEIESVLAAGGVKVTTVGICTAEISGCTGCGYCSKEGKCVKDDLVNAVAPLFEKTDCLIVGAPVHFASPCGTVISFLDRLFCSCHFDKRFKVGGSVAVARRGGATASLDVLNKYFTISGMPIAGSQYWPIIHGNAAGEVVRDEEGMQSMRALAQNALFLMRSIELGKREYGLPEAEKKIKTNFIR